MLIENKFWHSTNYSRIEKIIAQYEITSKVPFSEGLILEFGVFKGTSVIRLAHYLNYLTKKFNLKSQPEIFAFDSFGEFPTSSNISDSEKSWLKDWGQNAGLPLKKRELEKILKEINIKNINLIKGDIFDTLPIFLKNNTQKFSLVHLDVDLYTITEFILSLILPRMCKGGVIMLDDYMKVDSASQAIDEFSEKNNLEIKKIEGTVQPYYFIL